MQVSFHLCKCECSENPLSPETKAYHQFSPVFVGAFAVKVNYKDSC